MRLRYKPSAKLLMKQIQFICFEDWLVLEKCSQNQYLSSRMKRKFKRVIKNLSLGIKFDVRDKYNCFFVSFHYLY